MSAKLAAKLLKDMQPPDAGEIFRDMYSGYSKSIVGISNQMSIEVANEILSGMDLVARIGIVEEFYQSRSSHSQQSVISQVPLLRPGVLAEKEEWANFTSNQASDFAWTFWTLCKSSSCQHGSGKGSQAWFDVGGSFFSDYGFHVIFTYRCEMP